MAPLLSTICSPHQLVRVLVLVMAASSFSSGSIVLCFAERGHAAIETAHTPDCPGDGHLEVQYGPTHRVELHPVHPHEHNACGMCNDLPALLLTFREGRDPAGVSEQRPEVCPFGGPRGALSRFRSAGRSGAVVVWDGAPPRQIGLPTVVLLS